MRKKLKRILSVLFGVCLLYISIIGLTYMLRGYIRLCGFYDLEENSVDVVFVGTSVTFSAFMPMEAWKNYGIVAYDYCTNVQFENALRFSLVDVERTQNPRVIMVDIAPFLYAHYAGNPQFPVQDLELYIMYNLDSRKYTWDRFELVQEINQDIGGSIANYLYHYFDISRCHNNSITIARIDNAQKDVTRGYGYLRHNGGEIFSLEDTIADDGSIVPLAGREQKYLDQLLETASGLDVEIVFYCAPIYFTDTDQIGKKNYLKTYIEEKGFTFKDFSGDVDAVGLDYKTDFWSSNHFDYLGAEKVTRFFCEYLISTFDIPNRTNDERYAELNSDYEEWQAMRNIYIVEDRND